MGLQPIYCAPGICKVNSLYASGKQFAYGEGRIGVGRYTDGTGHRFVAGFPEKIGGYVSGCASQMVGRPNASCDYRDSTGNNHLCIGTSSHLYTYDGTNLTDVTPYRYGINNGTLTNPFTVTGNSATVAVADTNNHLTNGQWVFLGSFAVGGITINGWYPVSNVTGTSYNITLPVAPVSGGIGVGGTISYQYPTLKLGASPLATQNTSQTVTVTHTSHGANTGDYVQFSGATTFNNVTISGEYQLTVVNANSYTIQAGTVANATGSGGGSSVIVSYDVSMTTSTTSLGAPTNYGSGLYGAGPLGYSTTVSSTTGFGWTVAAYGYDVVAAPIGGTIYFLDTINGGRAHPLLNAPSTVNAVFVTPERFIFALGINGNGLTLAWPDQSDPTNWTPSAINTANSGRTLQGGDYLIGGIAVANGVSLMWTNRTCFLAQYVGGNLVYSTEILASGAPIVGPTSMTVLGGVVYWQGDADFWQYNGTVTRMPSDDIRDYVFTQKADTEGITFPGINSAFDNLSTSGSVRAKQEVWFHYPDASSTDNNRYVIYHVDQQCWSIGVNIPRTTWIDSHLFGSPYATDLSGNIWQQEVGVDANGSGLDFNVTTAMIDISNGDVSMDIMGFIPDAERIVGNFNLTIFTAVYPEDTPTSDGPYTLAPDSPPRQDLRSDGKLVSYQLDCSDVGSDIRFGVPRIDIKPANARL
jgi:hypothetical protein